MSYSRALQRVNRSLKRINSWFLANRLSLNLVKSEAMVFSRKTIYFPLPPVKILENPIPFNFSVKFLGVLLDFKLNWKSHLQHIRNKLSRACGILYQIRNKITLKISIIIYNTLALPYINYCNIVWASCSSSHLQPLISIQKKIVRIISKSRRLEHSTPIFKQLKLLKLADINFLNAATFVYKSINRSICSPIHFSERTVRQYNLRQTEPLNVPFSRSSQSKRFIHIRGATIWNSLPLHVRSARTIVSFKKKIKYNFINSYNINN